MFVFSYFKTESEAMHLAVSDDGLQWRELNNGLPVLKGTTGKCTLRDPFIIQARDGLFHLLATDGWGSRSIVHATSRDLVDWSDQELLPVMEKVEGTQNCWAPECFYDREDDLYRILWSSTVRPDVEEKVRDHRIWSVTTRDFQKFSEPELFFDPGYSVIDASVIRHERRYMMAFKDERGENVKGTQYKGIRMAFAKRGAGPFEDVTDLVTPHLVEGPALFRAGGRFVMLYDHFMEEGHYGASVSDDGVHWDTADGGLVMPFAPRHGGLIEVSDSLGRRLQELAAG